MAAVRRRNLTSTFALAALSVTALVGFGASMAFAAGNAAISNPSYLTCPPQPVHLHKTCALTFTDEHEPSGYHGGSRSGQHVCFSTAAPNTVTGTSGKCAVTNAKGIAYATFTGNKLGSASVTAKEATEAGISEGKVTRTFKVVR